MEVDCCLVWIEWRPPRLSMCLPLVILPCTIKSRKLSRGTTGSPGLSQKKGHITVVVVVKVWFL